MKICKNNGLWWLKHLTKVSKVNSSIVDEKSQETTREIPKATWMFAA